MFTTLIQILYTQLMRLNESERKKHLSLIVMILTSESLKNIDHQ